MADILTPDLCVIGGGNTGLAAIQQARALGLSAVLVERGPLGGSYVNTGALPARALAAAAAHAHAMRSGAAFGIAPEEPRVNTRKLYDSVQRVIAGLAATDLAARLEAAGIRVIAAEAHFTDAQTLVAGDAQIKAKRFLIATGARTLPPAITGLADVPFFTSETILDNSRKLSHLLIVGGGPVGLELAQSHRRLGTDVTVIEPGTPLPDSDPELATIALERMREEGVDIRANTNVVAVQARSQGIGVTIRSGENEELLDVSHILIADTRAPDLDSLGLEAAGIRRDPADPTRLLLSLHRTSNRRVYAAGSVTGAASYRSQIAADDARLALAHAFRRTPPAGFGPAPVVTFTDPEIAEIGLTEAAARARHGDGIRILRASFADNDRARVSRQAFGVAKLVIARDGRILGAGIVGDRAGELIGLFALALAQKLGIDDLRGLALPAATLSEIVTDLVAGAGHEPAARPLHQRLLGPLARRP